MTLTLRPYQREAISAVYAAFERGVQAPLVVMPTGSGKGADNCDLRARDTGAMA